MDLIQALILALVQGLTEFLPISSSGHLILPSALLGWPDQGLAFDVAVHFGTLMAVLLYFRRDIAKLVSAFLASLVNGASSDDSRLGWWIIVATIPAVIAGFFLDDVIESQLRSAWVLGSTTLIFGILLGVAQRSAALKTCRDLTIAMVLIIGFAQAMALIPGTSRSGITITAGAFLGLSLTEASRFSFLLSIPVIAGAALLKTFDLLGGGHSIEWSMILAAIALSGVTAFLCIGWFMRWVERIGLIPFAVYRVFLSVLIFGIAYTQL